MSVCGVKVKSLTPLFLRLVVTASGKTHRFTGSAFHPTPFTLNLVLCPFYLEY